MLKTNKIAFTVDEAQVILDTDNNEYTERMKMYPERFKNKDGIKYMSFVFHASTPLINRRSMGITLATQKRSLSSAVDQLIDFEHQAEDFNRAQSTNVIGHICELWLSDEPINEWIVQDVIPKTPVLTRGILALYTRKHEVEDIFQSIVDGERWFFSLEAGPQTEPDIWLVGSGNLPHQIIPFADAPRDLQSAAAESKEEIIFAGQQVAYLLGGQDGRVNFIGGALTKRPAGYEQDLGGNHLKYLCSIDVINDKNIAEWKSLDDVPASVKTMDGVTLTLSQCNHLARIADAVKKESPNVNEWAVAKSQFKELYRKSGNGWERKEAASTGITFSEWDRAYINDLPDSAFIVIEGDYLSGKTEDKNCRHLPVKDAGGKVDLPHLQNAFARANQIKAVSGPESDSELRNKATTKLEKYRKYLKGDDKESASSETMELIITNLGDVVTFNRMLLSIIGEEKMPVKTFETDEEWLAEISRIGNEAVEKAIADGKVIASTTVAETMIPKAEHAKLLMASVREYKIASMGLDPETTAELKVLASSDVYTYDEAGEKKFDDACKRWKEKFTAPLPPNPDDKKKASTEEATNFDPGNGNNNGGKGGVEPVGKLW